MSSDQEKQDLLLALCDDVHDGIHMMRHMAEFFTAKADDWTEALAAVILAGAVDPHTGRWDVPDNVVPLFPLDE
jgi:hypothetical protein